MPDKVDSKKLFILIWLYNEQSSIYLPRKGKIAWYVEGTAW